MNHRIACALGALVMALAFTSATPAGATAPSPSPLVVIDPGHGGPYSNANANGLREKNVNLAIALELQRSLVARGYRVKLTRTTDTAVTLADIATWNWSDAAQRWSFAKDGLLGDNDGIPKDDLQARCDIANRAGADLFISIHANGSTSTSTRGTEAWSSARDALGTSLAPYVQREVVRRTSLYDRGAHTMDFYVCRWSNMPAILVESAFISNPTDASLLKQSYFRRRMAEGIAAGVDLWWATKPYKPVYSRYASATPSALAVAVSRSAFPTGAPIAVVAPSHRAEDVPGAPALAATLKAPLLWADQSGLSTATAAELKRLGAKRVVLLGISGSYGTTMAAAVASASAIPASAVQVKQAASRSALAVSICASMPAPSNRSVIVASAEDTQTTLAVAAISAAQGTPLVLAEGGQLSAEAKTYLTKNLSWIQTTVVAGPATKLSSNVTSNLPSPIRVDGVDFSQRSAAFNARYFRSTSSNVYRPVVATFRDSAVYLTAASHAGRRRQPLMPVAGPVLPTYSREWLTNRRSTIGGFEIMNTGTVPYLMDQMLRKADFI